MSGAPALGWLGLALLPGIAATLLLTGLPAYLVLIGAAGIGAAAAAAHGDAGVLTALPSRLVGLLDNDLLQALPLYVLMGALLNRLPLADILFRAGLRLVSLGGRARLGAAGPKMVSVALGALLAPMNGSVGASVTVLSRAIGPRLAASGVPARDSVAVVAVASTLGVVVPPSLVLILLGDAMLTAHTMALNEAHRIERVVNTQDVFRGALGPAALVLLASLAIAGLSGLGRTRDVTAVALPAPLRAGEWLVAAATLAFVLTLLAGVVAGYFYAVEAAAMGAVALLVSGALSRHLTARLLRRVLAETAAISGLLFALLMAATTFTLVARALGTDRLLAGFIASLPGDARLSTLVVLGVLTLSAFALDAFEIIFVIVPLVMPPLLVRVPDAVWVSAMTLLALQASYLVPPLGYAVMMARGILGRGDRGVGLARAVAPFLAAQIAILALAFAWPGLTHVGAPPRAAAQPTLSDEEIRRQFQDLAPLDLPPPVLR
ncbi:MAG: TRAP transporter large permease subunit [Methylobacteriaceae bacterium]|nr:TRAP transporter large permease subunit [Methylobacteriaceae bacterium]